MRRGLISEIVYRSYKSYRSYVKIPPVTSGTRCQAVSSCGRSPIPDIRGVSDLCRNPEKKEGRTVNAG